MNTGVQKEKTYSPLLKEIQEIPANLGIPSVGVAVPAAPSVVSANANMQTSKMTVHRGVSRSLAYQLS